MKEELTDLRVDHEILTAKHKLTLTELEKKVEKANTSLTNTQHSYLEQTGAIRGLEAANSDLVSLLALLE